MKDYLNLWSQELLKLGSLTLKSKLRVTGERNQHLGPRWDFARLQVSVEPASQFEVVDAVPANEEARREGYLDWAVFGLLDVLLVAESAPLKDIRITLESVEHHAADSSPMAFRHAGRDAGQKIIEHFRTRTYVPAK
ncbi:MAG TPA: hypothetical protein VG167_07575 [Verrucomicrobiae bacterium]|nr:hypothetical protein [Verrucomicrobiae bacterium]